MIQRKKKTTLNNFKVKTKGLHNCKRTNTLIIFDNYVMVLIYYSYQKRMGIEVGETKVLIHVKTLTGRKYVFTSNGDPIFEKQFCSEVSNYPLQAVVYNISAYDEFGNGYNDIEHIFPINSICFTLTNPYYGSQGVVSFKYI